MEIGNLKISGAVAVVVVLALLLIIYVILTRQKCSLYSTGLHGMWNASPDFLEKAEISGMCIYIGEPYENGLSEKRKAYIIMYMGDTIIANKRIDITVKKGMHNLSPFAINSEICCDVEITESDMEDFEGVGTDDDTLGSRGIALDEIMPKDLEMYYDISANRIALKGTDENGDDRLYAELFKVPS
jgi:hypothetical protein